MHPERNTNHEKALSDLPSVGYRQAAMITVAATGTCDAMIMVFRNFKV